MSTLQTINRITKKIRYIDPLRQMVVKFYLVNIERRNDLYCRDISSEQTRNMLSVCDVVLKESGWEESLLRSECADSEGNPVPWYTLPAIEYLSQLDWSSSHVFEFGCGNSTLWWSKRAASVTSVEDNEAWHSRVGMMVGQNCSLHLETNPEDYANYISTFDGFDVIVVDGIFENGARMRCAEKAIERLRPGGLIILDNSDWLPRSSELLRGAGLIEVDMAGITPLNTYACTTSLFMSRDFIVRPLVDDHPRAAVGGVSQNWETNSSRSI